MSLGRERWAAGHSLLLEKVKDIVAVTKKENTTRMMAFGMLMVARKRCRVALVEYFYADCLPID